MKGDPGTRAARRRPGPTRLARSAQQSNFLFARPPAAPPASLTNHSRPGESWSDYFNIPAAMTGLRITVGTPDQNDALLAALREFGRVSKQQPSSAPRRATVSRDTKETRIELTHDLDGAGKVSAETGVGLLRPHARPLRPPRACFACRSRPRRPARGRPPQPSEDVGISLGEALARAVGNKKGIRRYGFFMLPMGEALAQVAVDLSGRPPPSSRELPRRQDRLVRCATRRGVPSCAVPPLNARMNLHVTVPYGTNDHHVAEAIFKAFGRALRMGRRRGPARNLRPLHQGHALTFQVAGCCFTDAHERCLRRWTSLRRAAFSSRMSPQ